MHSESSWSLHSTMLPIRWRFRLESEIALFVEWVHQNLFTFYKSKGKLTNCVWNIIIVPRLEHLQQKERDFLPTKLVNFIKKVKNTWRNLYKSFNSLHRVQEEVDQSTPSFTKHKFNWKEKSANFHLLEGGRACCALIVCCSIISLC